jgi:hypothetical protein
MTTVLLRDKDWEHLDGQLCKVSYFDPMASVRPEGKVISSSKAIGYAAIQIDEIDLHKLPEPLIGNIVHSADFKHLWHIFEVRGVQHDEVVAVTWTNENYKSKVYKLVSAFLPKLIVYVLTEESYRLWDITYKPGYGRGERLRDVRPILELKPPVMK